MELGLVVNALPSAVVAKQVTFPASLRANAELRSDCVNILTAGGSGRTQKKIRGDESFGGPAASLVPAEDLTVSVRIECGIGGQAFFSCPETAASVYSLEIHRGARIPPRAEPGSFGQNKNVAAAHRTGQNFRTSVCQARLLTDLGGNDGIGGGID